MLPEQECDVVMKGGITSGVVYPGVLFELAEKYRFRSIGGASAGAIAAGIAAAAEYGRQHDNPEAFDQLSALSRELSTEMLGLFQPSPEVEPLFTALLAAIGDHEDTMSRGLAVVGAIARRYRTAVALGLVPALAWFVLGWVTGATTWMIVLTTLFLAMCCVAASLAIRAGRALVGELPKLNFGICSGASTGDAPALTEWLDQKIQVLAGLSEGDDPLTFGDLFGDGGREEPNIELLVMTTSLTHQRPFQIPFQRRDFAFDPEQFRALFGDRITAFMVRHSKLVGDGSELRWLPKPEQFPILVAVRMSLSFPALLSAVPLHARDYTYRNEAEQNVFRPVWMSDGGICSNFPIHFFDSVWPTRPTFGINLIKYKPDVHPSRVHLPTAAGDGILRPFRKIDGLGDFFKSILDTMQDWRDVTQSAMPGYRERIVQVALDPTEGGLNLAMPEQRITRLADYGRQAGERLVEDFDFAEHRWRRHIVWLASMENMLDAGARCWDESSTARRALANDTTRPWGERAQFMGLHEFLDEYAPHAQSYGDSLVRTHGVANLESLMDVVKSWEPVVRYSEEGKMYNIPSPKVVVRLTPSDDLLYRPMKTAIGGDEDA